MRLVYGDEVARWVAAQLQWEAEAFNPCAAIGVVVDDRLIAGVVYNNYRDYDVQMTIASIAPHWATRRTLHSFFHYPFMQLGCARATASTAKNNHKARAMLERLGFVHEGKLRRGYDGRKDAMIYGLLREEATKWIRS